MCGRYSINADPGKIGERFGVLFEDSQTRRHNVKPSEDVPAVVLREGQRCAERLRWGLIPEWADDEKVGYKMINARAETILEKKSFRDLVSTAEHRCLIVADGFYEWMKPEDPKQKKTPMRYGLVGDELFSFAGLWSTWSSPSGEEIGSCTIITTGANDLVMAVHDRMPVVLPDRSSEAAWLDSDAGGQEVSGLLVPLRARDMHVRVAEELIGG